MKPMPTTSIAQNHDLKKFYELPSLVYVISLNCYIHVKHKWFTNLNLRYCNIMHCIMYCYPYFVEKIRKMKRDNQRGTTVFHPETFDAKIGGDKTS